MTTRRLLCVVVSVTALLMTGTLCAPTQSEDQGEPCATSADCDEVCAVAGPCEDGEPAPPNAERERFCTLQNGAACVGACIVDVDEVMRPAGPCAD